MGFSMRLWWKKWQYILLFLSSVSAPSPQNCLFSKKLHCSYCMRDHLNYKITMCIKMEIKTIGCCLWGLSDGDVTSSKLSWHVPKWRNDHELLMLQLLFHLDKPFNSSEMLHKCLHVFRITRNGCSVLLCWMWPVVCVKFTCLHVLMAFFCVFNCLTALQRCKSGEFEALSCPKVCIYLFFRLVTCICFHIACWAHLPMSLNRRNMQIQTMKRMRIYTRRAESEASRKKTLFSHSGVSEPLFSWMFVPGVVWSEISLQIKREQAVQSPRSSYSTYRNSTMNNTYTCCVIWMQFPAI